MKRTNARRAKRRAVIHSIAAIMVLVIASAGATNFSSLTVREGFMPVGPFRQNPSPQEILASAAEKGKQILAVLQSYSYYAELTLQTVSQADVITGKYYRFSRVYYDSNGTRQEKVFEDKSTLPKEVFIGTNAINNMTSVYRFIVTPESFSEYEFNYVGRERIDELNTYVFDVKPVVKLPNPEKSRDRYLKGRIWIDDRDMQVVKVAGEAVPEQSAHKTPRFESYFENYDKYWFPAYMSADDEIRVGRRRTRVVVELRFTRYKKEQGND
ncbi:MAG: hypothetical protein L0229_19060 [Blastocatellia bacterium]|nr:hypothetical protein [Blastocatellia bacterium]